MVPGRVVRPVIIRTAVVWFKGYALHDGSPHPAVSYVPVLISSRGGLRGRIPRDDRVKGIKIPSRGFEGFAGAACVATGDVGNFGASRAVPEGRP